MKQNRISFNKTALLIALAGALTTQTVQAANWLMLQGTEADHQAPRAHLWGFVQADYQHTSDTKIKAGPAQGQRAAFNQLAPDLNSASGFNIKRARLAVRGANLPLDKNINYFLMAEFGKNGITTGGGSPGQLTDASVTFNHIPGARIRVGLFKTPGSEESFKAIPVFNYVNYTNGTDRLLIERKIGNLTNQQKPGGGNAMQDGKVIRIGDRTDPVYAARDTGVQVFDSFKFGEWEHSYAVMLGNGNGLSMSDDNNDRDLYLYASTEKSFNNKGGPRSQSMKFYAWSQSGKRDFDGGKYDRDRKGLGMTYFDGKYRAAAEYVKADGMIFGGAVGAKAENPKFNMYADEKADAYHIDLGYRVTPKAELNVRYDRLNSAKNSDEKFRELTTTTLGAQYFLNLKTSVRLNYEIRDIEASRSSNANAKKIVDGIDNRVSAQVTMVF